MITSLLLFSLLLQIAVAVIAMRAPRSAHSRAAWWVMASAMVLMAMRALFALAGVLAGQQVSPTQPIEEGLAAMISALLLLAVVRMKRLSEEADAALTEANDRETALRQSEELWQRVFEFAPDGYIMLELDGRLDRMNIAAAEIAGVPREASEGRYIFELGILDEAGLLQAATNLGILQRGGDPGPAEYTFHRADGSEREVEVIGYMIEERSRPLLLTIVHDVTRRRHTETELRPSRLRLEEAQRVAGVVTFEIDLKQGTLWVSNDTRAGVVSADGRTQMTLEEGLSFVVPEDRERVAQELADGTVKGGSGDIVVEYRRHDVVRGREAIVRTTAKSEFDEDGNVVRLIGATVDLTDIRRAEQEVRTLNAALEERVQRRTAELERAVDELEAFSYSVSHDLRSPLRAMAGYSELLLEEEVTLNETSRSHLERIRASSVRMAGFIDGLLSLSRLTRAARNDVQVDLSEIARGILGELRASDRGRDLEVTIEDGLQTVADEGMMSLVLQNLLANAWKFTRSTPQGLIEFGRNATGAFYVRDNGVGFDSSQAFRLFRPFERLHPSDEFEGTGIGLATVARIVHRHGGRAWAEGRLNKGSTFWFTLAERTDLREGERAGPSGEFQSPPFKAPER